MPSLRVSLVLLHAALLAFRAAAEVKRPMSFADILAQREFSEVRIRPDGMMVAFLIKRARVEEDDYVTTLYVRDLAAGGADVMLAEGKGMSSVRWRPGSNELSYWDGKESRLILVDAQSRASRAVTLSGLAEKAAPATLAWSPDGARLAAMVPHKEPERTTPYLYLHLPYQSGERPYPVPSHELVVFDADGSIHCRSGSARWFSSSAPAWGPQGRVVAFTSLELDERTGSSWHDANLLRAHDCTPERRIAERRFVAFGASDADILTISVNATVQPDDSFNFGPRGNRILRARQDGNGETVLAQAKAAEGSSDELVAFESVAVLSSGAVIAEAGDRASRTLFFVEKDGLRRADRSGKRLSSCSIAAAAPMAACVVETSTQAPEIGIVDLQSGSLREPTRFNQMMASLRLGKVERVAVPDDSGRPVTMYLVYPVNYRAGARYPAIVVMYGFNNGFISQAQYITSYAPQVYAARGYVTLLWNYPPAHGGAAGDLAAQARDFQLGQFAATRNAVRLLIDRGLADPARIGVAGHSMGSHWADYAITHGALFAAASSHSPGGYTPISYWRGHTTWRRRLDRIFGGPPAGDTLPAWQALSPAFFAPPKIPQLREVGDSEISGEFAFRHWPDSGAPVEMIVYPNETHVFNRPQSRLFSMELNLDWFDFWLRGIEDPAPAKAEQYNRWRAMREKQCKLFKECARNPFEAKVLPMSPE